MKGHAQTLEGALPSGKGGDEEVRRRQISYYLVSGERITVARETILGPQCLRMESCHKAVTPKLHEASEPPGGCVKRHFPLLPPTSDPIGQGGASGLHF